MNNLKFNNALYKIVSKEIIKLESLLKEIGFVLDIIGFTENYFFINAHEEFHLEIDYETKDVIRITYYKYNCCDDGDVDEEYSYDIYIEKEFDIKKLSPIVNKIKNDFSIRLRKRKIKSLLNG